MKLLKNKGFTLAEMLIVMAVVVVLAAAAIPAIAGQVEKARESSDVDTIRAAYVDAYTEVFMKYSSGTQTMPMSCGKTIKLSQKTADWQSGAPTIGSAGTVASYGTATVDPVNIQSVVFYFTSDGSGIKIAAKGTDKINGLSGEKALASIILSTQAT